MSCKYFIHPKASESLQIWPNVLPIIVKIPFSPNSYQQNDTDLPEVSKFH